MSERYYVVSERELETLRDESFANGAGLGHAMQAMAEAEAACRARPVPEWATHFAVQLPPNDDNRAVHLKRIKR